jgi:HEAT repeat protein
VVPALLDALTLGGDDYEVQSIESLAASALTGVGEAAVPEIARRLASGDSAQVRAGAKALGLIGRETAVAASTAAVPTLIRMLTGDDSVTAARALAAIGPAAVAATPDLLKAVLRDVESTRRQVAPLTDGYIKDRDTRLAIDRSMANRALGAMGAAAVNPLLELLRGDDALARRFAMAALGRVGPAAEPAVPEMVAYLRAETDPGRRVNLMFTFAGVGDGAGAAVPALAGYLGGTGADAESGRYAAQALAKIGAKAVPALITALRHPDAVVRQRAATALGEMAPGVAAPAREALQAATRDADPAVAAAARQALVHLGGDTSRPAGGGP